MRPIQARISIGAMAHNLRVARAHAGEAHVFAVVKANAYGHGLSRARRALAAADGFAVLTLEEAANLRLMGVEQPILLLEGCSARTKLPPAPNSTCGLCCTMPGSSTGWPSSSPRVRFGSFSSSTAACTGWGFRWPIMPPSSRGSKACPAWPASP
jgi:hypothetical protein